MEDGKQKENRDNPITKPSLPRNINIQNITERLPTITTLKNQMPNNHETQRLKPPMSRNVENKGISQGNEEEPTWEHKVEELKKNNEKMKSA